eukprot:361158-Chlamydomonas_euryale.AAC.2
MGGGRMGRQRRVCVAAERRSAALAGTGGAGVPLPQVPRAAVRAIERAARRRRDRPPHVQEHVAAADGASRRRRGKPRGRRCRRVTVCGANGVDGRRRGGRGAGQAVLPWVQHPARLVQLVGCVVQQFHKLAMPAACFYAC